jgi:hypothetical protein
MRKERRGEERGRVEWRWRWRSRDLLLLANY